MAHDLIDEQRDRVEEFMRRHRIGLLTLVFTDIVGSAKLKQALGDTEGLALLEQHHARLREVLAGFREGEEISTSGDSFLIVFSRPSDAAQFALALQRALRKMAAQTGVQILDRVGIHVGEVFIRDEDDRGRRKDLFGIQVDTCARIMSMAEGDQILLTRFAYDNARQVLAGRKLVSDRPIVWLTHGLFEFKGVTEPLEVCEVGEEGLAVLKRPVDSEKAFRHQAGQAPFDGWRPAANQLVPGSDWRLTEKLGEGGFGEVWRAQRGHGAELAAFKFASRSEGRLLLANAWRTSQTILQKAGRHPGIVEIMTAQLSVEPSHLRMEMVAGHDLAAWCALHACSQRIRSGAVVAIVTQLAEALDHAHRCGITHQDLKPANVLVAGAPENLRDLTVKLTDFGFWNPPPLPAEGSFHRTTFMGTPLYLSPEQASGEKQIGPPADIYALGSILYELLTGRPPFVRTTFAEIIDAHRNEDPRLPSQINPEVPGGLERICLKAMEKRPPDRYRSALEMAADLRRFARGERITTRPKLYDNIITSRIRRHVQEIQSWRRDQLLTDREFARLAGAYTPFDRSGLEAVLEARRLHLSLMLLLTAGWLMLDGSTLWLVQNPDLDKLPRILIAWFPILVTNALWGVFWRHGSYRAAHVVMLLGSISLPAGIGVLLDCLDWLNTPIGEPSISFERLRNRQLLAALSVSVAWSAVLGWRARTVTISALCAAYAAGIYTLILDFQTLSSQFKHPAPLALKTLPFALLAAGVGTMLGRLPNHRRQAVPWFAAALSVLVVATLTMAFQGPDDWGRPTINGEKMPVNTLQGLLLVLCAAIYFPAGLILRRWHLVSARAAYATLLWLAPVCLLGGVALMGIGQEVGDWNPGVDLFGQPVALLQLFLGFLSIGCILLAAALQIRVYAFIGLAFMTLAEWKIAEVYIDANSCNASWAIAILLTGSLLTAVLATREIRQRRKHSREDMDDVAERLHEPDQGKKKSPYSEDPLRPN